MLPSPRRTARCRAAGISRRGRLLRLATLAAARPSPPPGSPPPAPAPAFAAAAVAAAPGTRLPAAHPAPRRHDRGGGGVRGGAAPIPAVAGAPVIQLQSPDPFSTAQCLATLKIRCYSPLQYRVAYDLNPLYRSGVTGKGRTIVIIDSFGSPTIRNDLGVFDRQWGLPDPPALDVLAFGKLPKFSPSNATMDGWAEETTLDVEYAHAIAPGRRSCSSRRRPPRPRGSPASRRS